MATPPIYIGYDFTITPLQPATEILIAELGYAGFESFVETTEGVKAYIQKEEWHANVLEDIHVLHSGEFSITYTTQEIEQVNWNEEWEKNFTPIIVDDICSVRAPFHEQPKTEYDIIIEPKMSFGTGHHETTHMMIQHLLQTDVANKKVLDMGCGTGVLAILAAMKGATPVDAVDIDNWCYLNTLENIERNACNDIKVYEGDVTIIADKQYDIIIANINRNILIADIQSYVKSLSSKGTLFLSGFYKVDLEQITEVCVANGLECYEIIERNDWLAVHYMLK